MPCADAEGNGSRDFGEVHPFESTLVTGAAERSNEKRPGDLRDLGWSYGVVPPKHPWALDPHPVVQVSSGFRGDRNIQGTL